MSVSIELLEALKASQGGVSDYRAAKLLQVSQPVVSKYRSGLLPMSPEKVILACEFADLDPKEWLLKLYRERAKCTKEAALLDDLLTRMAA